MIIKQKAYFIKDNINLEELEKYGFYTLNECSWWRDIKNCNDYRLVCYKDNRIIKKKFTSTVWTTKVKKYIKDLIGAGLIYKKNYYYIVAWNSRKWSDKKIQRVFEKVEKLQTISDKKILKQGGIKLRKFKGIEVDEKKVTIVTDRRGTTHIYDKNGNDIYHENSDGYWGKSEYDKNGNEIYFENSYGRWTEFVYNENGKLIYYKESDGYWLKYEYDKNGNRIYREESSGEWKKWEYDENGKLINHRCG